MIAVASEVAAAMVVLSLLVACCYCYYNGCVPKFGRSLLAAWLLLLFSSLLLLLLSLLLLLVMGIISVMGVQSSCFWLMVLVAVKRGDT